jgi:hypothetical protein
MKIEDPRGFGAAMCEAGGPRKAVQVEESVYPVQAVVTDTDSRVIRFIGADTDGSLLIDVVVEYTTDGDGNSVAIQYDNVNNPGRILPDSVRSLLNI